MQNIIDNYITDIKLSTVVRNNLPVPVVKFKIAGYEFYEWIDTEISTYFFRNIEKYKGTRDMFFVSLINLCDSRIIEEFDLNQIPQHIIDAYTTEITDSGDILYDAIIILDKFLMENRFRVCCMVEDYRKEAGIPRVHYYDEQF